MISGFGCYIKYLAIKSHFQNDKYDYFKYHGSVKATERSFETRNDRYFFEKLAKKLQKPEEVEQFFVANLIENNKIWIGDIIREDCQEIYIRWKGKLESIGYRFESDLDKIFETIKDPKLLGSLFKVENGQRPEALKMMLRGEINIETVILLNILIHNFLNEWAEQISDKIVYPEIHRKIVKYSVFLKKYLTQEQMKNLKKKVSNKLLDNL